MTHFDQILAADFEKERLKPTKGAGDRKGKAPGHTPIGSEYWPEKLFPIGRLSTRSLCVFTGHTLLVRNQNRDFVKGVRTTIIEGE